MMSLGMFFEEFTSGSVTLTTVVALVLLPLIYYGFIVVAFLRRIRNIGESVNKFPGPTKHWLFGNLHQLPGANEKGMAFSRDLVRKHPRAYRMWIGPLNPTITVAHPDLAKLVLRSSEPKQMGFMGGYSFLKSWLGEGLLLASGSKWLRNRRLLTPGFHFDVLRPYMKISNEAADILVNKLTTASKSGNSVEICQPVCLCALNVILRCACSYNENVQLEGASNPYANSVLAMAKLLVKRFFKPYLHIDALYNLTADGRLYNSRVDFVHKVSQDIIEARQKALKENPEGAKEKKYPDFLDILLLARDEDGKGLTNEEIRNEVDTFMFEGHDTTASGISFILYELARHPQHQEECRREVDRLLEERTDSDIEWDDLQEIPYLTMCIKEAMRINPPVPVIGRETSKQFELDGVIVPKGTRIGVSVHLIHTNRAVWGEDAMEFKPERFHQDRMKHMDPYAYVPFSAGPRNCIGQNFAMHEIKVVVAKIIHRFELKLDETHEVARLLEVVIRAKNGIKLFLTPRNQSQ